ncbi:MAG: hypothetical protein HQK87_07770 [Nitrospinae bacterium]|nr:hypothetical protein [Nitrospinota bacterium]
MYGLNAMRPPIDQDDESLHTTFAPRFSPGGTDIEELARLVEVMRAHGATTVKLPGEMVFVWEGKRPLERDAAAAASGYSPINFAKGGVRPVKLCSAETFCQRFKQPVLGLAEELERRFADRETGGAKVVIGVAGCQRSCSEPATKDIGIVAGGEGYKIMVGGMNGFRPRIATPLMTVATGEEVVAVVDAVLDYVAAHGDFMNRLGALVDRNGIEPLAAWVAQRTGERTAP